MSNSQCACCPVGVEPPEGYNIEITSTLALEEQVWSDERHLQLGFPTTIKTLEKDLNNDPEIVRQLATNYGCCSSFRVMSDEGSRVLDHVVSGLEKYSRSCPRIPKLIRGGTFRSEFLNAMGHSPSVLRHVSALAGCEMVYHPMKIHQLHVNMKPNDANVQSDQEANAPKKNVDRWHCDSTPFVLIVFCTNPDDYTGGTLQYFNSPKEEGLRILSAGQGLPEDRVMNVGRQEKGYGVFMQGWRVFHQVTPVLSGDARTTMVFSFHPRNVLALEACSHLSQTYAPVDPLYIIMPDWVRFRCWKVARRLEMLRDHWDEHTIKTGEYECTDMLEAVESTHKRLMRVVETLPYTDQRNLFAARLLEAIADLKTYLWATYPDKMSPSACAGPADTTELKVSISSVADLEGAEVVLNQRLLAFDYEFMNAPEGLSNLMGAVEDIDNCISDVLTLQETESKLVYF